ncbi:MAG: peptide deformylase [Pseudomonadota bacterium]
MALREIITYPHKVLLKKANPISEIDKKIWTLIDDMAETMYDGSGVGLAANQVGELRRVILVDTSPKDEPNELITLINPEIIMAEGSVAIEEGCLSCLDFRADIPRAEKIIVRALDKDGKPFELRAEGIQAIALQHEIDHLNGILIINHVSSLKRELYKRKLKKMLQKDRS